MEYKNLTVSKLLTTSPILCELVKKVEALTKLNQVVAAQLDPQLSKHCRVHSYEAGILTLSSSSPAWGHTLRFAESELLSRLRSYPEWCGLISIRSRVLPENSVGMEAENTEPTSTIAAIPKPIITKKDADFIQGAANNVNSESLRNALLKLAHRAI
jgi:hypothetical protein